MKTLKSYIVIAIGTLAMIACSPNNEDIPEIPQEEQPERGDVTTFNQIKFLQNNIVEVDSLGNFVQRVNGAPLNSADTTELYIGVANLSDAAEMFQSWLSPDTEVRLSAPSTIDMEAGLKDESGQLQETVYFKVVDESPTLAEVTFAKDTMMKHVSKVIFIKDSAWSENDESPWLIGDTQSYKTFEDGVRDWVCIRESKNGVSGLFLYISNSTGYCGKSYIKNFASVSTAKEVSEILRKDWDMYVALFDEVGAGELNKGDYYWINDWHFPGIYAIRLSDGDIDWFDIIFHSPYKRYIQTKTF